MAHNPHGQTPDPNYDPAGNTQMFRAFVDEGAPQRPAAGGGGRVQGGTTSSSGGSRVGLIVGVIVVLAVLAGAAWFALS
ncbi:hypothetical protein AB0M28_00745 [Streptomyces sp. NPDC051940]|uniref:hypothetical protein n=1 Tax=Streptomyces sp. NPDC051940 TaxID=3155675 RepID=UPI003423B788